MVMQTTQQGTKRNYNSLISAGMIALTAGPAPIVWYFWGREIMDAQFLIFIMAVSYAYGFWATYAMYLDAKTVIERLQNAPYRPFDRKH
jgi:hypothetical protein